MKKLNKENLKLLFYSLHKDIEESVNWSLESISNQKLKEMISYPPNVELSSEELSELMAVFDNNPNVIKTIKKIMINSAMYPLFNLFNIIDGSGQIPDGKYEFIELVECKLEEIEKLEDREDFLHDLFFETYWEWEEEIRRKNK